MEPVDRQLFNAINKNSLDEVKKAIEAGADVSAICDIEDFDVENAPSWEKYKYYRVIHFAVAKSMPEIISYLLSKMSNPNELTAGLTMNTALHVAAWRGKLDNLEELLKDSRVQLNLKNRWGRTALHEAVKFNHSRIVDVLIRNKVDLSIVENNQLTPLELAIREDNIKIAQILLVSQKQVRRSPFENELQFPLEVSNYNHVLVIMRLQKAKNEEHCFLIVETLEQITRIELLKDKANNSQGYSIIKRADSVVSSVDEKTIMPTLVKTLRLTFPENWVYLACNITTLQLNELFSDIEKDMKSPPKYNVAGDKAALNFEGGHSCFSWAREKVLNLKIKEMSKLLEPKLSDWLAAKPKFYLKTPTFWSKNQETIFPAGLGFVTGTAFGYIVKSKL